MSKTFIQICEETGRVTLEDALNIAVAVGLFSNEDINDIVFRARKQKVRSIFRNHKYKGGRVLRSVKTDENYKFVNVYDVNVITKNDVRILMNAEDKKIDKSTKEIKHLERINRMLDGQISLDDVFTYDQLYSAIQ